MTRRMNQQEFTAFLRTQMAHPAHNFAVEIGGEGKVVVLRWAKTGSEERTEKKVLLASQSPVMIKAAYDAFVGWFYRFQQDEIAHDRQNALAEQRLA